MRRFVWSSRSERRKGSEMVWGKMARSARGNLQAVPTPVGGAHVAAVALTVLLAGCGGIPDEEIAATDEPLMNAKATTNPYAVYYCGGGGCCTGTFVGPYALLSSRHCTKKLQADDWISVRRYDRTPEGELDSNTVKRVLRKKWGTDGLLLIELKDHVGQYTSVCQELFKKKDRLKHYGAGATNKSGSHDDDKLRVSKDGINFSGLHEYKVGPRHGSKGDSGGPYMYDDSVVGVHYGHKWKRSSFSGKKEWDVATNLAEGWVFRQGISVAKRRCKPGRGLTGAAGSASGQLIGTVEASGRKIRFGELRWDGTYRGKAGTIKLFDGITASGQASARNGFCGVRARGKKGNAITFYEREGGSPRGPCNREAGTIHIEGARLSGGSTICAFNRVYGRTRSIDFDRIGDKDSACSNSLRFER